MICPKCGKTAKVLLAGMCQGCYNYFKNGGIVHKLPNIGEVARDSDGKPICHICGRSYTRLGSHIRESHGMTIKEYKERFGLCARANTTEQSYHDKMSVNSYKNNMDVQVLRVGEATRIKKGENHLRKGKPIRMQEILNSNLRKRGNKNGRP